MTLQEFLHLPKLHTVKKGLNGYTALCPAHKDEKRTLSIDEKADKIVLKCFAHCSVNEICAALDIEVRDLFCSPYQDKQSSGKQAYKSFAAKKITAVYPYTDESGELLYENVRFEPKDFRQRRYDENGREVWSLNGTRRVPYRLPELVEAVSKGADIFLCEGEKDADNLRSLGLAATSFKNWKPEFNDYLKSSHVCLICDHDKAGLKQADDACKLLFGNVASLKTLDFFAGEPSPEKHGKDFSDWFESEKQNGLSLEEIAEKLCILTDNASVWQPPDNKNDNQTANNPQAADADFQSLLVVKSANAWIEEAKLKPMQKMIFDEFWLEGEVCIFFGDTGKNKTTLAVQIADSVSRGASIANFKLEAEKQMILYLDCELSEKQFERRYAEREGDKYVNHYIFDENFQRVEINRYSEIPRTFAGDFERYLFYSLEYEIARTGARILIVDNITYLKSATETAKDAMPLMKELIRLKMKYELSIMALAHTPKRDLSRPITVNDLQGSKMLSNFSDNIFAIGESAKDKNLRYLKQIKPRNGELVFDAENVAVCQLVKPDNFLRLEFLNYGNECEHLKQMTETDKSDLIRQVKNLSALGENQRTIAKDLGISLTSVNRYLKK
jgi:hypothetical protein